MSETYRIADPRYQGVVISAPGWRVIASPSGKSYRLQVRDGERFETVARAKTPHDLSARAPAECPFQQAQFWRLPLKASDAAPAVVDDYWLRREAYSQTDWARENYGRVIAKGDYRECVVGLFGEAEVRAHLRAAVSASGRTVVLQVYAPSIFHWLDAMTAPSVGAVRHRLMRGDYERQDWFDFFDTEAAAWRASVSTGEALAMLSPLPVDQRSMPLPDIGERPRPLPAVGRSGKSRRRRG